MKLEYFCTAEADRKQWSAQWLCDSRSLSSVHQQFTFSSFVYWNVYKQRGLTETYQLVAPGLFPPASCSQIWLLLGRSSHQSEGTQTSLSASPSSPSQSTLLENNISTSIEGNSFSANLYLGWWRGWMWQEGVLYSGLYWAGGGWLYITTKRLTLPTSLQSVPRTSY